MSDAEASAVHRPLGVALPPENPPKDTPPPEETPPDLDDGPPDENPRVVLHGWIDIALRLMLIFGAMFSAYQYLMNREETRIGRTLDLVETWERPDYQDASRALRDRLEALNTRYAELLPQNATDRERAIFKERIGIEAMTEAGGATPLPAFRDEFDRIVYFLNRLGTCVNGNLCSPRVADEFFRDYAASFWSYFAGYIERERKRGQPTYALAIETYVKAPR